MATSSSSTPAGPVRQLTTPEYRNWLALGHALTTVLCQGLRPFINRETEAFYRNVTARLAAAGPCTCVYVPRRKPNQYHDMRSCAWANLLQAHHHGNKPNWKQSDSTKWLDPNLGPWEMAKLFLPDLGGHAVIKSAEDMDVTGILNLMYWCNHFTIPQPLIKDVRDTRNNKWVHVPNLELSDGDKKVAFAAIENLLNDPNLAHDPDVQKAIKEIGNLKSVSDLHSMEARVLADLKEVINKEILNLTQESERNKEQVSQLQQQQVVLEQQQASFRKTMEVLEQRNKRFFHLRFMLELLAYLLGIFFSNLKGFRKGILLMLLFWSFCNILDKDTFIKDGCAIENYGDPWKLKYFDFSEFVTSSRTEFIGRQWLYQEVEKIMEFTTKRGVLLIGNPGSGKTAFVCHLLCSRTSSPFIHDRILGYHFCMHSDKGTQNAAKFVRNLANMVASRFDEYHKIISSDSFVQEVLQNRCQQDPEWCFQEGILTPLTKLQHQPKQPWYIIIDALDECSTNKAEILNMLKSKVRRLPRWLKLLITSRNISTITTSLDGMQELELRSDDARNLEDIDTYSSLKIYPLQPSIIYEIKEFFSIRDNNTPTQRIVSNLVEKSQGNFLFVKVVLDFLLASKESVSWTENFPKTLDSNFQLYFERKFGSRESFQSIREIFEVLVAAYRPLSARVIHSLLKLDSPTLDYEYDVIPRLKEVSLFLWHGDKNDLVRIYHASLSEWLTSETSKGTFYYVKKENGHKRLAKYYLQNAKGIEKPLTPEEAFHLASHIVEGGSNEHLIQEFLSLPSNLVNSSDESNTNSLHISSRAASSEVTQLLTKHFYDVDCLDNDYRTPAFMAATAGCLENLVILFERGASLNHTVPCVDFKLSTNSQDQVRECRRMMCEYSFLHIAAQEGNADVLTFLIKHHVNLTTTTGCNNTAIHLAAKNGHLKAVAILKNAGGVLDGVSLHHAAAGGHSRVVDYLLNKGVRDDCINDSLSLMEVNWANNSVRKKRIYVYDNHHLKMRETALHAAVKNGHPSVIQSLLRHKENAIACFNAAGRGPLHEAVHVNDYNVLKVMLLAGVDTSVRCNASLPTFKLFPRLTLDVLPQKEHCPCGFTPLHIAAMHGYHSVASLLVTHNADLNSGDCNGSTPLHIASCHGMVSLITLLVHSGAKINRRSYNGSTPLHSASACFATSSFRPLLSLGSDFFAKDNKSMTALDYILKDIKVVGREYFADLYVDKPKDWIEEAINEKEIWGESDLQNSWLNALIRLTKSFVASINIFQFDAFFTAIPGTYDKVFQTAERKSNASFLLTGSDNLEFCYLVLTATPPLFLVDIMMHDIAKRFVLTINRPYEPTLIPAPLKKALSRTFAVFYPGVLNCSLLAFLIRGNLVRSANIVLQAGADVNCQDQSGSSPLLTYLHRGGRHMSKVLAKHKVTVDISCGTPFERSALHLVSYHKLHYLHYLPQFLLGEQKWFQYLTLDNSLFDYFLYKYDKVQMKGHMETVRTGEGPLALAIMLHPQGTEVINECFDADGYNALHRAAQGANVIAIKQFLTWGANPSLENADGFSPLWLSVVYSVKYTAFLNFHRNNILTALELDFASMSASVILNRLLQSGTVDIGCNESRPDLTIYHIAAIRGMWQFISHLLSEKRLTGLDVNCPNKDGITPMYLAMLAGGVACEWHSPWCKVVDVIKMHGGTLRYPTLEAEYFIVFHLFYGMTPGHLFLELDEHEILTLQDNCGRDECRGYKRGDPDLLKSSSELDRVFNDYNEQVDRCYRSRCRKGCLPEIHQDLPHFQSGRCLFRQQRSLKQQHGIIRDNFDKFLEKEIKRIKSFLVDVTRPHTRVSCRASKKRQQNMNGQAISGGYEDMCTNKADLESVLRMSYRNFKKSFEKLQKHSKESKSFIFSKGSLPRVLSEIRHALYSYDITLQCDWQAIATKYVMLSFQIRNLILGTQHVNENSRVVSISDFASFRMGEVFIKPSKESLRLVLRLASEKYSEDLDYLTILRFRKPPLWKGTFTVIDGSI